MSPSRLFHGLIAVVFAVIGLNGLSRVEACCGETPDWFFTAFIENQPLCTNRDQTGGSVTWSADYHLNSAVSNAMSVHVFGDGVISNTTITHLTHQPGAAVDTINKTTTWQWQWDPLYDGTARTVRVQIDLVTANDFRDGAMLRITCNSRGLQNWEVENVEGFFEDY